MSEPEDSVGPASQVMRTAKRAGPLGHAYASGSALPSGAALPSGTAYASDGPCWTPALAVWESEQEVLLCLDVPGFPRDEMEVNLDGTALLVVGAISKAPANDQRDSEPRARSFRRRIPLPGGLRTDELDARVTDGVLEIRIPRGPDARRAPRVAAS